MFESLRVNSTDCDQRKIHFDYDKESIPSLPLVNCYRIRNDANGSGYRLHQHF